MKKSKLIISVATLCLAIAVLCFGVYAVQTVNYSLSGNIKYEVTDAYVEINTKVYSSSTFMEQSQLYDKIDEVLAGTYTGLTEESVNIPTYNSTDKEAIPEKELDISFVGGETPKLAYFVVVNIKNLSDTAVWANVNNPSLPDNVYQVNSGLESEITTNKNVVIALSLENQYKSVSSTAYTLSVQVGAQNNPISNFDFDSATKQISLKAGANPTGDLVIPSYINGTRVTKVGSFAGANATSIYVPTSAEQMTQYCFADCKYLTELSLPFTGGKNYVSHIEAYNDTTGFEDEYPLELYNYFGNDMYYEDNSLTVDNNLLYQYASDGGHGYMPKSLATINLLYGCRSIDNAFWSEGTDSFIQTVNLPNSLTRIGESAFLGCTNLTSIIIPSSVESIEWSAFNSCTGLASITIPSGVTSIMDQAFYYCTGLTSITMPSSVSTIGEMAFDGCTGLQKEDTANGLTYIKTTDNNYFALNGTVTAKDTYAINKNCKFILDRVFNNCTSLTSIEIPSSVISIGSSAFYGCTSLSSITIPSSVTRIGADAFRSCTSLTSITIPKSVTTIKNNTFNGCTKLTSITIPNSVTSIEGDAFRGCTGLLYTDTENNLKYIKTTDNNYFALYRTVDTNLTSCTINNRCKFILNNAFSGCTKLISITIPDSVKGVGYSVFYNCKSLQTINVPFREGNTPSGWDADWKGSNCTATVVYAS